MSNKTELQNNNAELQEILDSVNDLPDASGGGSGIETCNLIIHASGVTSIDSLIPYIDDNGTLQVDYGYEVLWTDHNFRVPKGSIILISRGFTIESGDANIRGFDGFSYYNNALYQITGDVEITIG